MKQPAQSKDRAALEMFLAVSLEKRTRIEPVPASYAATLFAASRTGFFAYRNAESLLRTIEQFKPGSNTPANVARAAHLLLDLLEAVGDGWNDE